MWERRGGYHCETVSSALEWYDLVAYRDETPA